MSARCPPVPTSWGAWEDPAEGLVLGVLEGGLGGAGGPGFWWLVPGRGGEVEPGRGTAHTPYVTGELTAAPARNDGRRAEGGLDSRGAACVQGVARPPLSSPLPLQARCWQDLDVRTTALLSHPGPSGEQPGALRGGCQLLPCSCLSGEGVPLCCSGVASSFSSPAGCPPPCMQASSPLGCGVPHLPCDRPQAQASLAALSQEGKGLQGGCSRAAGSSWG